MPATHICTQPTSPCITIDGTTGDDALHNARIAFYGPSGVGPLHGTTSRAVTNLLACLRPMGSPGRVMMVGHGSAGRIMTGSGAFANDTDKRIEFRNFNKWDRPVGRLRSKTTELTFCSCDTGANPEGAQLLMKVANHIQATVSGFTGQIFIDATGTITCEAGGRWQHAQPGIDLPPVAAPVHQFGEIVGLKLKYGDEYRTVKIGNVSAVHFSNPAGKRAFSLEGEAARKLVRTINFAEPAEIDGAPLAMITGLLQIEFSIDEHPDDRTFTIFNNRLLYDQTTRDTFYYASPALAEILSEHRSKSRKSALSDRSVRRGGQKR